MTRFDAADPAARRKLFVDAIVAHRERASPFLTIEVHDDPSESARPAAADDGSDDRADESELGAPWIQFADGVVNVDCTESELERLKGVLEEFPAFKIDELHRPEDAPGVNVRVSAKADPNRIAQFIDAALERTFELPSEYRAWVVEL